MQQDNPINRSRGRGGGGGGGGKHMRRGPGSRRPAPAERGLDGDFEFEQSKGRVSASVFDTLVRPDVNVPLDPRIKDIDQLRQLSTAGLIELAHGIGLDNISRLHPRDILNSLVRIAVSYGEKIEGSGSLDILPDSSGFLRSPSCSYMAGVGDIFITPLQIKRFGLRPGDTVKAEIRLGKEGERYLALLNIETINGKPLAEVGNRPLFEDLTPLHAEEQLALERGNGSTEDITARVIDIVAPIGKGQRGLIVSPPKAGKTMILQHIAQSIAANHPECILIVLLVDERPEEVTEMQRMVQGEVISSTFDEPAGRHVQAAEMVIEKAKRMVELGKDVVILLDSITRLARAYNMVAPQSSRILSGGIDAAALHRPKRFFGAARNIEGGGSLSIIATALVETGSKMDEVIYEEFKGTGNMELHLERRISEKRIFPAISIKRSGTRREEKMIAPEVLQNIWVLRRFLHPKDDIEAVEMLLGNMKKSKTNSEFFESMRNGV